MKPLIDSVLITIQLIVILLLVDFLSGVFHWLEDSYGSEQTPVFGRFVVTPNIIHHHQPRDFVRSPFWHRNVVTMLLSGFIFSILALIFGSRWQVVVLCGLGALCNEFHCWAHRSAEENGRVITMLHRLGILQTPRHHAIHHTNPKNRGYCVFTNYMNPLLDRIDFWRRAEKLISIVSGVNPRPDTSLAPGNSAAAVGMPI